MSSPIVQPFLLFLVLGFLQGSSSFILEKPENSDTADTDAHTDRNGFNKAILTTLNSKRPTFEGGKKRNGTKYLEADELQDFKPDLTVHDTVHTQQHNALEDSEDRLTKFGGSKEEFSLANLGYTNEESEGSGPYGAYVGGGTGGVIIVIIPCWACRRKKIKNFVQTRQVPKVATISA